MFLASDSVCEFLDQNTEQDTGSKTLNHVSGSLKFENIDVQYSQETRKALDNFNLEIQAGERVALVGRSGSGKTTVVNLLPRFVSPSHGKVLIDGENINDLRMPPANHLELLEPKENKIYSIRVNKQYRLIFKFENGTLSDLFLDPHTYAL